MPAMCRLLAGRLGLVRVALPLLAKSLAGPTSASSDWVAGQEMAVESGI